MPAGNPGGDVSSLYIKVEGAGADQLYLDGVAEAAGKHYKYFTPIKVQLDAAGNRSFTTPVGIIIPTDIQ